MPYERSPWVIVTAREDGGVMAEEGRPDYEITAAIEEVSSKFEAVRKHSPHLLEAVRVPPAARQHLRMIEDKLDMLIRGRDSTHRLRSEIRESVAQILTTLFDQFQGR